MPESEKKGRHAWAYLVIAICLIWTGYLALFGPRPRAVLEDSAMAEPAAYDWTAFDITDQRVPFASFKGKTVFLNIWATWCGPCVREMPSIARLADNLKKAGNSIEFVCVSIDDSTEKVRNFVSGRNWPMTFLRADQIPPVFTTEGIPATFVIAADGKIVASEVGAVDWDDPRVETFLKKHCAVSPAAAAPSGAR